MMVSVYRRPLPTTNLTFLSAVMFDGRETISPLTDSAVVPRRTYRRPDAPGRRCHHRPRAGRAAPHRRAGGRDRELRTRSVSRRNGDDRSPASLSAAGAQGGPCWLCRGAYYPGVNDSLGGDPSGVPFDAAVDDAVRRSGLTPAAARAPATRAAEARRAIAAGEALFNSAPLQISNVRGLNDNAAIGSPESFVGHCTSCHDTPNVGNHSLPLALDIGTATPGAEHGDRSCHRRGARSARYAGPARVPGQRLPESLCRQSTGILLHQRSRQSAGHRQVRRLQPH